MDPKHFNTEYQEDEGLIKPKFKTKRISKRKTKGKEGLLQSEIHQNTKESTTTRITSKVTPSKNDTRSYASKPLNLQLTEYSGN